MGVNLELYRVFCTAAQLKNISKASEVLYISQSATSRAIQSLEKQLGCTLFIRERYGVALTPEGQRLYDDIILAYEKICSAEARLNADVHLNTGIVNIGCSPLCLYGPLITIIEEFRRAHPGVTVNLDSSSTFDIRDRLSTSVLDYALLAYPKLLENSFTHTFLYENSMVLCAGNDFPELKGRKVYLKDLDSYPQVGLKPGISSGNRELWYSSCDAAYHVGVSVNVGVHVLQLVEHNMGIGLMMDVIAQQSIEEGRIFSIDLFEKFPSTNTYFVQNPMVRLSHAATALKSEILNYFWLKKRPSLAE